MSSYLDTHRAVILSTLLISKFRFAANVTLMNRNDANVTVMNRNDSSGWLKLKAKALQLRTKQRGSENDHSQTCICHTERKHQKTYVFWLYINLNKHTLPGWYCLKCRWSVIFKSHSKSKWPKKKKKKKHEYNEQKCWEKQKRQKVESMVWLWKYRVY